MNINYDLIIVGGGPAGVTAGIYAARHSLKALLITNGFGGQMAQKTIDIENYTGFEKISGIELISSFEKHLRGKNIEIKMDEVAVIEKTGENFLIKTKDQKQYQSKTVIVATGSEHRILGIPGEKEFIGRGVSYCVACDGPMFKNKTVAVIGGGDAGVEAALFLSDYTVKVFILEFGSELKADAQNQKRLQLVKNAEVIFNAKAEEIKGEIFVKSLIYRDTKFSKTKIIDAEGVFVEVGYNPATAFVGDIADLNEKKEIIVDPGNNQTKTKGLFAAGDVTNNPYKQIIISAGDGAKAALSAHNYIKNL
ncbi:MAG: FAD-dependent oxidoreductase [Patescibacteria group bacterium]